MYREKERIGGRLKKKEEEKLEREMSIIIVWKKINYTRVAG